MVNNTVKKSFLLYFHHSVYGKHYFAALWVKDTYNWSRTCVKLFLLYSYFSSSDSYFFPTFFLKLFLLFSYFFIRGHFQACHRAGVHPSASARLPFSKIFCETTWPIKAKFYVEPPWEGGTTVFINGAGHMTKIATTPIY